MQSQNQLRVFSIFFNLFNQYGRIRVLSSKIKSGALNISEYILRIGRTHLIVKIAMFYSFLGNNHLIRGDIARDFFIHYRINSSYCMHLFTTTDFFLFIIPD